MSWRTVPEILCLSPDVAQQVGLAVQGLPVALLQGVGLLLESWIGVGFGGQTGELGTPCLSQRGELPSDKDQLWRNLP